MTILHSAAEMVSRVVQEGGPYIGSNQGTEDSLSALGLVIGGAIVLGLLAYSRLYRDLGRRIKYGKGLM